MKTLFNFLRLGFFLLILALVFHNVAARFVMSAVLRSSLGVPVKIESARVDFLSGQVFFRNVLVQNPEDFPEGFIAKIPYLLVDLDIPSFFDGKLRFEKIEVDVADFQIARAPDGRMNWFYLRAVKTPRPASSRPLRIDHFILTLRRGTIRDLAKSGAPQSFVLEVDNQDYLNVHSVDDMVKIISWEAFKRMRLEKLGAGVLDEMREDLEGR